MKRMKISLSIALVFAVCNLFPPAVCTAKSAVNPGKHAAGELAAFTQDKGIFLYPWYNCDPKMLITSYPNIDPRFLIELR